MPLYTSNRKASEMHLVAQEVAQRQRDRLVKIFNKQNLRKQHPTTAAPQRSRVANFFKKKDQPMALPLSDDEPPALYTCKFIFVDMCTPLSSVRYARRLEGAGNRPRGDLRHAGLYSAPVDPKRRLAEAVDTLDQVKAQGLRAEVLEEQIADVKNLEAGVQKYNQVLAQIVRINGDEVVELGKFISEETIAQLILTSDGRLKVGAMKSSVNKHVTPKDYEKGTEPHPVAIIDQVHPTDFVHKLIWQQILTRIRASDCTFGLLDFEPDAPYDLGKEIEARKTKFREGIAKQTLS